MFDFRAAQKQHDYHEQRHADSDGHVRFEDNEQTYYPADEHDGQDSFKRGYLILARSYIRRRKHYKPELGYFARLYRKERQVYPPPRAVVCDAHPRQKHYSQKYHRQRENDIPKFMQHVIVDARK